jgi:hypothetical protein
MKFNMERSILSSKEWLNIPEIAIKPICTKMTLAGRKSGTDSNSTITQNDTQRE